ncbi:MAG: thiamine pyrophosphate-binding protein, partial [Terriglobia bacterium]
MGKSKQLSVDRRKFLTGVAAAGAATLAAPGESLLAQSATQPLPSRSRRTMPLLPPVIESDPSSDAEVLTEGRSGSDFMVDVIKSLGFEYVCVVAGSSFRALHESVINYGGNQNPELLTCLHEEAAVGMGHGYFKIEHKPLLVLAHGTVGLQHASMAIYNAYCDRVPVYIMVGNTLDATYRDAGYGEWPHSAQDAAAMVRDYLKWDDMPVSLQAFAESTVRAYKIAMTQPTEPVLLVAGQKLQERPIPAGANLRIPKLTVAEPPQGDSGAVAEAARLLAQAENPVIVVDRAARTQAGMESIVELAGTIQAPVIDDYGRMNFPSLHPLNQTARRQELIAGADVILGLELADFWSTVNSMRDQVQRTTQPIIKPGTKLISITADDLDIKSNYQDFYRYQEVDVDIAGDVGATLPSLIEAVKRLITADRKAAFEQRGANFAAARQKELDAARTEATYAWDASPVSVPRLCQELWGQIRGEDWSLVSYVRHDSWWPLKLWTFDKHYQFIGGSGGGGMGYNAPASVGAALANRKYGRLTVNLQD